MVGVLDDMGLALSLADRVLVMQEGHVVAEGARQEVLSARLLEDVFGMDVAAYMKGALARWETIQ